jgi:nitrite reductase (NADH) small subunit
MRASVTAMPVGRESFASLLMNQPLYIDAGAVTELPLGRAKAVAAADRKIALFHTAKGFFAVDNTCPHRGGPLAEGDVIGDEIVCPWHLWGFDLRSGKCAGNPEISVAAHEVRLEGDRILVKVDVLDAVNMADVPEKVTT